jgi:ubiquinone/menaquinone biosynthesis C-methylase UbiE
METNKQAVKDFWNEASCGEELYLKGDDERQAFNNQAEKRYQLEPYIIPFAGFDASKAKKVLEVGVGLGADHQRFAASGANLFGIDITERAITNTGRRLSLFGLSSKLQVADAEQLPFENNAFDVVYSWGVIHHSPNTPKAITEIYRVLKQGGEAKIMIYHTKSFVGYMLWLRYGLMALKPFTSLATIYSKYLESPGTKAYTTKQAKELFKGFTRVQIETVLTHGDLLSSDAGQRHKGVLLTVARKLFPRALIKIFFPKHGLFMLIRAIK